MATGLVYRVWLLGVQQMCVIKELREACGVAFHVVSGNHDRWLDQRQKKCSHAIWSLYRKTETVGDSDVRSENNG